ncbi:hypothetical protein [Mycolicibacterium septicum]|uniref:hypothetical protein n=1 Tax=Mycolicibacterium septicum TaxID=98668 RepID=UPI001AFAB9FB|nr:hypothetical protein [Mycolicibacterium septicum]QRY51604.1 hypothetical protein JVX95_30190 [Mycolicibacterium septicum]
MNKPPVINGSAEPSGKGEVEFFDIRFEFDDDSRSQFESDPEGTVRSLLEEQGHVVNAVILHNGSAESIVAASGGHWAHIFRPPHEASKWIHIGGPK